MSIQRVFKVKQGHLEAEYFSEDEMIFENEDEPGSNIVKPQEKTLQISWEDGPQGKLIIPNEWGTQRVYQLINDLAQVT